MRILVYGAGVLGCELTHVLLQNKKNVVTLLARGEWKEMIDQKGLVIRHWAQRRTTTERVKTIDVLAPDDFYDLVFVVVQAGQLPDVLPVLKANRSQYFVFVGNDPHAKQVLEYMQRPADKIAFGFQNSAGHREHGRVVSAHVGVGMTVGGATAPLSGAFRIRLKTAFDGTKYKLTFYSDMDEWLKCHIAFILPVCYVCYACNGDLTRATRQQRGAMIDAAYEACLMLKDAGIPVNDKENTDVYKPGSAGRRQVEAMVLVMAKTPLGRLCASDHAMNAVSEMKYLDEAFEALRRQTGTAMPMWESCAARCRHGRHCSTRNDAGPSQIRQNKATAGPIGRSERRWLLSAAISARNPAAPAQAPRRCADTGCAASAAGTAGHNPAGQSGRPAKAPHPCPPVCG